MSRIIVVLHRPIYPRNIGMCARAIGNLDGARLVIVAPQGELTDEAKQGAAHAQEILSSARIYKSVQDFYANEGEGLRIALSGRDWRLQNPTDLEDTLKELAKDPSHLFSDEKAPLYLMFGAEDDGLSQEEMELCHHVCRLPVYGEIKSFNLSHAVLLTLYIVQKSLMTAQASKPATEVSAEPQLTPQLAPAYYPSETIKKWLETLGFDLSSPRVNIEKTLNRIFLSNSPKPDELKTIDFVLQQTVRKLRQKNQDK